MTTAAEYIFRPSQFEGAYAMAVVFLWIPLGTIVGLIGGGIFGFSRR